MTIISSGTPSEKSALVQRLQDARTGLQGRVMMDEDRGHGPFTPALQRHAQNARSHFRLSRLRSWLYSQPTVLSMRA